MAKHWIPQYLNTVDFLPGHKVSAEEWNAMFNLSRIQGNNNAEGIELILRTMGDSVALPSILDDYSYRIAEVEALVADIDGRVTSDYIDNVVSAKYVTYTEFNTEKTNISTLTERVNTAEQKITPEAITSTVSSEFYKKTEVDGKLLEQTQSVESKIDQKAGEITLSVNEQIGGLGERLSAAELSLTSDAIISKIGDHYATKTVVDGIDERLTTVTSDLRNVELAITADAIVSKVSNTFATKTETSALDGSVSALSERVTTNESNITQLSDSIASQVSRTDELGTKMSTFEQTADGFTFRIQTIENDYVKQEDLPTLENGKSAYEIWLEAGNTGTLEEYLESLKGDTGKGIQSIAITYQIHSNGTTAPTGTWETNPPPTTPEKPYMWTKAVITYTDNNTSTMYSVGATPEGVQANIDAVDARVTTAQTTANSVNTKVDELQEQNTEQIAQDLIDLAETLTASAEEIMSSSLQGYATTEALNNEKEALIDALNLQEQDLDDKISALRGQVETLGGEVANQSNYLRIENANIIIGKTDSLFTSVFTNNSLEFRYNNIPIAWFNTNELVVKQLKIEAQITHFDDWAVRKGAYIDGVGYNLNDVWIGG